MFKADDKVVQQEFKPLPNGVYQCVCIESEVKSDDEYGTRFEFTFVVDKGPHHKKRIWGRHVFIAGTKTKQATLDINTSLLKDIFFVAGKQGFESIAEAQNLAHDFVGIELLVSIKTTSWQGKEYTNPVLYYKTDGTLRASDTRLRKPIDMAEFTKTLEVQTSESESHHEDVPF